MKRLLHALQHREGGSHLDSRAPHHRRLPGLEDPNLVWESLERHLCREKWHFTENPQENLWDIFPGWRRSSILCIGGKCRRGRPRSQVNLSSLNYILFVKPFLDNNNKEIPELTANLEWKNTRWLRDNMGMIKDYAQAYELASQVDLPKSNLFIYLFVLVFIYFWYYKLTYQVNVLEDENTIKI